MPTNHKSRSENNKPDSPVRTLTSGNVIYIGVADDATTQTDEAKWQIERIFYDSSGEKYDEFASEGEFDQIWDDILSITDYPTDINTITLGSIPSTTVTASGLSVKGKHTEVALNSATWTKLPTTALTGRNQINIQNNTAIDIKVNYEISDIDTEIPGYTGMLVASGLERLYAITDDIPIFGKSESGTPTIDVEELS